MKNEPLVSVIIPTRNEEKNIYRCLNSIVNSTHKNVEIIIVDQKSTDKTVDVARKFNAIIIEAEPSTKYIPPSNSRNIGFNASKGDYIYHLDADMEMSKYLLTELIEIFKDKNVTAVVVPEKDIAKNIWAQAKAFERSLYDGTKMEAARVSRRSVFQQVMYDTNIHSGEDWNIHQNLMKFGKIVRSSNHVNHYILNVSIRGEFMKKLHYGTGSDDYVNKNTPYLLDIFKLLVKIYLVGVIKLLFKNPVLVLAFIVLRLTDLIGLFMGLTSTKIRSIINFDNITAQKVFITLKSIKNIDLFILDYLGFKHKQDLLYKLRNGTSIYCRAKTTDVSEAIIINSDLEYPSKYFPTKKNPIIVDIGANIGAFSIYTYNYLQNKHPKIYAIEPSLNNFQQLNKNLGLYKNWNIIPFKLAISSSNGSALLDISGAFDSHFLKKHGEKGFNSETVQTLKFDTFCQKNNISTIDLLKIDIEGGEYDLFETSHNFIRKIAKIIMIEVHHIGRDNIDVFQKKYINAKYKIMDTNMGRTLILKSK